MLGRFVNNGHVFQIRKLRMVLVLYVSQMLLICPKVKENGFSLNNPTSHDASDLKGSQTIIHPAVYNNNERR